MQERPTVHFSNRLEELAISLGKELFKTGSDPFEKRIVLLPSHSLKLYLSSFFAVHPEWNICAGITFKTLLDGAMHLVQKGASRKFPSQLALSFTIEKELDYILENEMNNPSFSELQNYLGPLEGSQMVKEQKRVWVSTELSRLFYEYATFEKKALQEWLKKRGWKQAVWNRIFTPESSWKCLSDELERGDYSLEKVHLFGFSHLPSSFYQFFCGLGAQVYFLSPSSAFWEDLCSDKERIFLEKKMEGKKMRLQVRDQLLFYLKETHPLLANWGKVGRTLLRQLGDTESYLEEEYVDPLIERSSLLTYLQESLLELEVEKKEIALKDTSILCLSATSKLREVESLFETLQECMLADEDLEPKDILVLSPDLEAYLPYIQMVFGSEGCSLGFSAHGLSLTYTSESSQAIHFFFSLAETRFDRASLLKFLSFPSVMKKFEWKAEDLKRFEEWFSSSHVLWGLDPNHKKHALDKNWPEGTFTGDLPSQGTWEEGCDRLLKGLAMDLNPFIALISPEDIESPWPLPLVDFSEAELLGKVLYFLSSLKEDLKPLYENEKKKISEWVFLVRKWIDFYFEKTQVEESLLKDLDSLQADLGENASFSLSFFSFKRAIEAHFQKKKESFHSSHLNTVKFLSMELGSAYPSKILCVLGCDEGSFPRTRPTSCLEEIESLKETPSITEQDRYLFLELILHARQNLIFSYQRMSWKDQKVQGPSLLIQELMSYLDKQCIFSNSSHKISEIITRHHPAMSFDQKYFQDGFRSYSPFSFLAAKSYYLGEKNPPHFFFPSWQERKKTDLKESPKIIELKKIQEFAKDPIRFYFKENLGIFFDFIPPKEEEFFLSLPSKSRIKQEAFQKGLEFSVLRAQAKGELPLGEVGQIAIDDLEEDLKAWQEHLLLFGLQPEDVFSLELTESASQIERYSKKIIMPPLSIEIEEIGTVLLVGDLYPICSSGLLWTGKTGKAYQPRFFPFVLLFSCLAKELSMANDCLFLETGKTYSLSVSDPRKQLALYLKLYLRSLKEPCPVRPEWSMDFLSKTKEELEKKRSSTFFSKSFENPYEEWILKRDPLPDMDMLYKNWQEEWKEVFSPLLGGSSNDEL